MKYEYPLWFAWLNLFLVFFYAIGYVCIAVSTRRDHMFNSTGDKLNKIGINCIMVCAGIGMTAFVITIL